MTTVGAEQAKFPYLSFNQLIAVRNKLRQSVPKIIDLEWVMAALGTTEKNARNIVPQLKALGIAGPDGTPTALAEDLRHDDAFAQACRTMLTSVYPESLRQAHDDPDTVAREAVAGWFMRNAKTGESPATKQASLYIALLKAELPKAEDVRPTRTRRVGAVGEGVTSKPAGSPKQQEVRTGSKNTVSETRDEQAHVPTLHIDLQIHISSEASESQIEAVFKSMAKHLYGR